MKSFNVEDRGGSIPSFKGPFYIVTIPYNINREKGTIENFVVFSSGKRHSLIQYLWLKLVWDELSQEEYSLFISIPEVLNNDKIVGFLRARLTIPKKILRKKLLILESILGGEHSDHERYRGMKGMRVEIQKRTTRLAKIPKFSGYVKSVASIGKSPRGPVLPDPMPFIYEDKIENTNWYSLLTVEEFFLVCQMENFPPEESKEDETATYQIRLKYDFKNKHMVQVRKDN